MIRLNTLAMVLATTWAVLAAGCSTNPATGANELMLISTEQEIRIGREAAGQFEAEFGGAVPDDALKRYIQDVGRKLAAASDRQMPYEYTLLASNVPNAFALPGGKIYITAGLLTIMDNERQLAGVLGHETGHVAARHNVKALQRQVGLALLLEVARLAAGLEEGSAAEGVAKVVTGMANLKYSRNDEYQADMLGIRYMTRAGYNPHGMVEMLSALREVSGAEGGRLTEMFQTHPLTGKRIEEAKGVIQGDPAYAKHSSEAADPHRPRFVQMRERSRGFIKVKQ